MERLCFACGTALVLTGQRSTENGVVKEWYACRNRNCGQQGKPQGWRESQSVTTVEQDAAAAALRAAYAARMQQKRRR